MIGERRFPNKFGGLRLPEGGFGKDLRGRWWARTPDGSDMVKLPEGSIMEYPDATITSRFPIQNGGAEFILTKGIWEVKSEN